MSTGDAAAPLSPPRDSRVVAVRGSPSSEGGGPGEDPAALHATLMALSASARRALALPRDGDGLREIDDLAWRLERLLERVGPGPRLEPIRHWAENLRRQLLDSSGGNA